MKKFTQLLLLIAFSSSISIQVYGQDDSGYTYTLIDNGNYSYSIAAVPDASTSSFPSIVQSYGFTILVPDGVTVTITSSFGPAAGATQFDGSQVGMPTIDGYLITEVLMSPLNLPPPADGTTTAMATITVNGSPTSGQIVLLANDSPLATNITALKHFLIADMEDDGTFIFTNNTPQITSGLSGTTFYDFATLSTTDFELEDISIYPNPSTNHVNIDSGNLVIENIELFDLLGKRIFQVDDTNKIDVSGLQRGVYFMRIYADKRQLTRKLILE